VISIYCSITVNHRLTGPGKMVKVCLLFVGIYNQTMQLISQSLRTIATTDMQGVEATSGIVLQIKRIKPEHECTRG
jgi:hypothetical protein